MLRPNMLKYICPNGYTNSKKPTELRMNGFPFFSNFQKMLLMFAFGENTVAVFVHTILDV